MKSLHEEIWRIVRSREGGSVWLTDAALGKDAAEIAALIGLTPQQATTLYVDLADAREDYAAGDADALGSLFHATMKLGKKK